MIPKKYTPLVFSFIMAFFMSCCMSFVVTTINMGLPDNLLAIWLRAWSNAFIVAWPVTLIVGPLTRRLVSLVVEP